MKVWRLDWVRLGYLLLRFSLYSRMYPLHKIHLCPWTGMVIWGKKMIIIMMRLLLLLAAAAAKMMILALLRAWEGSRRRRSSSGGLLTKATNHGGLDKSCHPATITQSENDSTTSTRLHKSNASRVLLDDYSYLGSWRALVSARAQACSTKECEKNQMVKPDSLEFSILYAIPRILRSTALPWPSNQKDYFEYICNSLRNWCLLWQW